MKINLVIDFYGNFSIFCSMKNITIDLKVLGVTNPAGIENRTINQPYME